MKPPADGWDRDEQEVLAPLHAELEAIRASHALSEHDKARLLRRIQHDASQTPARAGIFWTSPWLLAAASVVIVTGGIFLLHGLRAPSAPGAPSAPDAPAPAPARAAVSREAPAAPVYLLVLNKPDLKVSPSALTYRSAAAENPLLADLKRAFDAFRAGDYAGADREFSVLAPRYPKSVEVVFYQGVARLFLADAPGAITSLSAARKIADRAFAWDVDWYLAVAEERAGNPAAARVRLGRLCQRADTRATGACDAMKALPAGK